MIHLKAVKLLTIVVAVFCVLLSSTVAGTPRTSDKEIAKQLVGQWTENGRIRVFYGNGDYFVNPEPEGRPVGKWQLQKGVLSIFWPPGVTIPLRERIVTISAGQLVTVTRGATHVYRRANPY